MDTCTYTGDTCGGSTVTITFDCPAAGSCVVTPGSTGSWGSYSASYNGTTIYFSGSHVGPVSCGGTDIPASITVDVNVLSWSAGTGGAARTPTQMQGTYSYSSQADDGCKAGATQQTISYG